MLYIDDMDLIQEATNKDGIEHVRVMSKAQIKQIFLDGHEVTHVYYADSLKGVLVKHKLTVDGRMLAVDGKPINEILFGEVKIVYG